MRLVTRWFTTDGETTEDGHRILDMIPIKGIWTFIPIVIFDSRTAYADILLAFIDEPSIKR